MADIFDTLKIMQHSNHCTSIDSTACVLRFLAGADSAPSKRLAELVFSAIRRLLQVGVTEREFGMFKKESKHMCVCVCVCV